MEARRRRHAVLQHGSVRTAASPSNCRPTHEDVGSEQVNVAVPEAGDDRCAPAVDHRHAVWNGHVAHRPDALDASVTDDDRRIGEARCIGRPIDRRTDDREIACAADRPTTGPRARAERRTVSRFFARSRNTLVFFSVRTTRSCMHSFVDELPRIGAVESANAYGSYEFGVEVSKVHSVLDTRNGLQRLPVRDAATGTTVNGSQSPVAPDVLSSGLRMAFDLHRAKLEVDPRSADPSA